MARCPCCPRAELTGISEEYARTVVRRLRQHRVIRGRTIRVAWHQEGFAGDVAVILDAMVACGELSRRHVDPKRSAAQRARKPETRARGKRSPVAKVVGPFTPKIQKSNPYYGLAEWDTKGSR